MRGSRYISSVKGKEKDKGVEVRDGTGRNEKVDSKPLSH